VNRFLFEMESFVVFHDFECGIHLFLGITCFEIILIEVLKSSFKKAQFLPD
jgi:hypothetical protein